MSESTVSDAIISNKPHIALETIRREPQLWFRGTPLDERDELLLKASRLPWLKYGKSCFLSNIYHKKADRHSEFEMTKWTVEGDSRCRELVASAGAELVGQTIDSKPTTWQFMTVAVYIDPKPGHGLTWGKLATQGNIPGHLRIFTGPTTTCPIHPWDAMILRNCHLMTDGLAGSVADKVWDILLMKMCEDFDHPWVVCAILDASSYGYVRPSTCCDH